MSNKDLDEDSRNVLWALLLAALFVIYFRIVGWFCE